MPQNLAEFIQELKQSGTIPAVIPLPIADAILTSNSIDAQWFSMTALEISLREQNFPLIRKLIDEQSASEFDISYIGSLIKSEKNDILEYLLKKNVIKNFKGLLWAAIIKENMIAFETLLKHGTTVDGFIAENEGEPIEQIIKWDRLKFIEPFIAHLSDENIKTQNTLCRTVLHSLVYALQDVKALDVLIAKLLKDKRYAEIMDVKDIHGRTILDVAKLRKMDNVIRTLIGNADIDVTKLSGYGDITDLSQLNLDKKLLAFLRMKPQSEFDFDTPRPYKPEQIIDSEGSCCGWAGWFAHAIASGPDAVEEFYAIQRLLAKWNENRDAVDGKPGLTTPLKNIDLPVSLKAQFPPIRTIDDKGTIQIRESTLSDLFDAVCNNLSVFHARSPAIKKLHLISGQRDRLAQFELIKDPTKKLHFQFEFHYPNVCLNALQLLRLFTYFSHFPHRIFDLGLWDQENAENSGHQIIVVCSVKGELLLFDSNDKERLYPFKDIKKLADYVLKYTAGQINFLKHDNTITIDFNAYQYIPSDQILNIKALQLDLGLSDLHVALMKKDLNRLKQLVKSSDILQLLKQEDIFGLTPMQLALKTENIPLIETLLNAETGKEKPHTHSDHIDFMQFSKIQFNNAFIRLVLSKIISIDFTDFVGVKFRDRLNMFFPESLTSSLNVPVKIAAASLLFLKLAENKIDFKKEALDTASQEFLVSLAVDGCLDINFADKHGTTPLILAAQNGLVDEIEILVRKGSTDQTKPRLIDLNKADNDGITPLRWAMKRGKKFATAALRNAGAQEQIPIQKQLETLKINSEEDEVKCVIKRK